MLLLKAAWGTSCQVVFQFPLRADWHVKTDGYIVNHLSRHASVRQHVVCMGERFRCQKFTVRIQLFPKTMGGLTFRNFWMEISKSIWIMDPICIEKSVGWFPSNDFCTSPQVLPAPAGWCPQWRIQVTISAVSGYHMSHANTWHMLSDITFVCGERLDDTPKTIPQNFFGHFCRKVTTLKSCEADNLTPASLPGLQRLKWCSLPGIDRSRKADMAEIKPEVGRGTEICATVDVSGCFFLDPRSLKLQF